MTHGFELRGSEVARPRIEEREAKMLLVREE